MNHPPNLLSNANCHHNHLQVMQININCSDIHCHLKNGPGNFVVPEKRFRCLRGSAVHKWRHQSSCTWPGTKWAADISFLCRSWLSDPMFSTAYVFSRWFTCCLQYLHHI